MGDLYAAQIGGVGFHSSPGEGAASWQAAMKMIHETHETHEKHEKNKKICVICVICGFFFFIRLRVRLAS
jgi:hypothetical protein